MRKHQSPEDKIVEEIFDMTLEDKDILSKCKPISSPLVNQTTTSISSTMTSMVNSIQNPNMQLGMSGPVYANPGLMSAKPNMPPSMQGGLPAGLQGLPAGMQGLPSGFQGIPAGLQIGGLPPSLQLARMQALGIPGNGMQPSGNQTPGIQTSGMQGNTLPSGMQQAMQSSGLQGSGMQSSGHQGSGLQPGMQPEGMQMPGMQGNMQSMQSVGITNSALNASLGLPIRPGNNSIRLPIQGVLHPVMPNPGMGNSGMNPGMQGNINASQMQPGSGGISGFPNAGGMPGMPNSNSSLFMTQNSNNTTVSFSV